MFKEIVFLIILVNLMAIIDGTVEHSNQPIGKTCRYLKRDGTCSDSNKENTTLKLTILNNSSFQPKPYLGVCMQFNCN